MSQHSKKILCVGALTALGFNVLADTTIYDSTGSYNGNVFSLSNGQEIGNQVSVNSANWLLTGFNIEYYSPSSGPSLTNVGIDVRFYLNDGALTNGFASPGTVLFDSGWFYNTPLGLPAGGPGSGGFHFVSYNISDFGTLMLPTNFTFTVSFTNLDAFNVVQLPLANNVTNAISSFGDYWRNDNGNWTLLTNSASAANLVAQFTAVGVPEPSMIYLGAIGGALLLGVNRLRKR